VSPEAGATHHDAGVTFAQTLMSDFDAATERLLASTPGTDEFRRALKEQLNEVYAVQQHRCNQIEKRGYLSLALTVPGGRVTQGLIALRAVPVHEVASLARVLPVPSPLYPGESLFPSADLYPGSVLTWLGTDHMVDAPDRLARPGSGPEDGAPCYRTDVAGRPVRQTLADARAWLFTGAGLPSL
jgi:hypothetical protein